MWIKTLITYIDIISVNIFWIWLLIYLSKNNSTVIVWKLKKKTVNTYERLKKECMAESYGGIRNVRGGGGAEKISEKENTLGHPLVTTLV